MITYRKRALKVKNIRAYCIPERSSYLQDYSRYVAGEFEKFIEGGQYSRIVDVFFYGDGVGLVCSIVYEQLRKDE